MIRFKHKGCQSEAIRFVGEGAPYKGMVMRSADWCPADGSVPTPGSPTTLTCPDCKCEIAPSSATIEQMTE